MLFSSDDYPSLQMAARGNTTGLRKFCALDATPALAPADPPIPQTVSFRCHCWFDSQYVFLSLITGSSAVGCVLPS